MGSFLSQTSLFVSGATRLISLPESVLASIITEADGRFPRETGGVVLGRRDHPNEAVITQMVGPRPLAKHGRVTFEPDYEFQDTEISEFYESERGVLRIPWRLALAPQGFSPPQRKGSTSLAENCWPCTRKM